MDIIMNMSFLGVFFVARFSARHINKLILLYIIAWGTFLEHGKECFLHFHSKPLRRNLVFSHLPMDHQVPHHWGLIRSPRDHLIAYMLIQNIWRDSSSTNQLRQAIYCFSTYLNVPVHSLAGEIIKICTACSIVATTLFYCTSCDFVSHAVFPLLWTGYTGKWC